MYSFFAGEKDGLVDGLVRLGRRAPPPRNSKEKCIHPKEFADFIADPEHIYTLKV
jgi:hypothetical protein